MDKKELEEYQILLKELLGAINLCEEGVFKYSELKELKNKISLVYNSSSENFKYSVWGRRIYKIIQSGDFVYTKSPRAGSGGLLGTSGAKWLPNMRDIVKDFIEKNDKSIKRLDAEDFWLQSNTQNGDEHIMIGSRQSREKSHLIVDHETGEIRMDPKDDSPHEIVSNIKTTLTKKNGDKVILTESSVNFSTKGPRISVYTSDKKGYFLLEFYNSGDEDVENVTVEVVWEQSDGECKRVIEQFFGENDNPVLDRPYKLNVLKRGETRLAFAPSVSLNGKIKAVVNGQGVSTGIKINEETEISLPVK